MTEGYCPLDGAKLTFDGEFQPPMNHALPCPLCGTEWVITTLEGVGTFIATWELCNAILSLNDTDTIHSIEVGSRLIAMVRAERDAPEET